MGYFTIDGENDIRFEADMQAEVAEGLQIFANTREFAQLANSWPLARIVEIWNGLPGVTEVKKFTDRKTAATRIWNRIQSLAPAAEETASVKAPTAARATRKAKPGKKATRPAKAAKRPKSSGPREGSKQAQVIALMERKGGASLPEIMKLTGWQKHTVRGFVAGTLGTKLGRKVASTKKDDVRVYELVG